MIRGLGIVVALSLLAACGGGGGSGSGDGIGLEDLDGDGQIVLLAFGDSITRGTGDGEEATRTPPGPAGYPARLEVLLGVPVFNAGRPGEETSEGRGRLRQLLAASNADYVLILEGVNDVEERRSTESIIANLQTMVDSVFSDGGMPILGTLTPACCNHRNSAPSSRIDALNIAIRDLTVQNAIPLIEFHDAFTGGPDLPYDETLGYLHDPEGLHPTPLGYDVMAAAARDVFL